MGRRPLDIATSPGATPLTQQDFAGLIPTISTQQELNELEKSNINIALRWARKSRKLKKELLTISGLYLLHEKMFNEVWSWAGKQRTTEKNIGVAPHRISTEVQKLSDDVRYWIENGTYPWSEIGVRFHHKLVSTHPFENGNGRHARISANLLLRFQNQSELTWGKSELLKPDEIRNKYLDSLRDADRGNFQNLINFASS